MGIALIALGVSIASVVYTRRSAHTERDAHDLEVRRHHEDRQPEFRADIEWRGEHGDIPVAVLEYLRGPDLEKVIVKPRRADGFREAFAGFATMNEWPLANFLPGERRETPILQPDRFGGRSLLVCECYAADREHWTSRPAVSVEPVGSRVRWEIQWVSKSKYVLANVGEEDAQDVHAAPPDGVENLIDGLPSGESIRKGSEHEFYIFRSAQLDGFSEIMVKWDGQEKAVPVSIPVI